MLLSAMTLGEVSPGGVLVLVFLTSCRCIPRARSARLR